MIRGPLISVVTPVYNGAEFLRECIESVLSQGGAELEYVILDNASTDATPAIIEEYALRDGRIRAIRNATTLPMNDNWNRALSLIAPESRYCRIVCADDFLYPDSLRLMVDVAIRHPSVGVVGSRRLRGDAVECGGLPEGECHSGRDVVRLFLGDKVHAIAPTGSLIRADLVREARGAFLPTRFLHADTAALLNVLDRVDFGFVDAVLMYSRPHANSVTATVAERRQTWLREKFLMLQQYGLHYFSEAELALLEQSMLRRYYRFLVRSAALMRRRTYLSDHVDALRVSSHLPDKIDLARAALEEMAAALTSPRRVLRHVRQRVADR